MVRISVDTFLMGAVAMVEEPPPKAPADLCFFILEGVIAWIDIRVLMVTVEVVVVVIVVAALVAMVVTVVVVVVIVITVSYIHPVIWIP